MPESNIEFSCEFLQACTLLQIASSMIDVMTTLSATPLAWRTSEMRTFRDGGLAALKSHIERIDEDRRGWVRLRSDDVLGVAVEAHAGNVIRSAYLERDAPESDATRASKPRDPNVLQTPEEIDLYTRLLRGLTDAPGFAGGAIHRGSRAQRRFPLTPPVAFTAHVLCTTDEQVAEAYDDPEAFFRVWDSVETVGRFKLCTRAPYAFDELEWLSHTIDGTMALARAAKPKRTLFPPIAIGRALDRFWTLGDPAEGKAGFPRLHFVGYDEAQALVEYAAHIEPDEHVLIYEIQNIRKLLIDGAGRDGQPVRTVRVVFASEPMARAEKRPLLDVGARVFFLGPDDQLVEIAD